MTFEREVRKYLLFNGVVNSESLDQLDELVYLMERSPQNPVPEKNAQDTMNS